MFMFLVQEGILREVHMDFMVSGHSFLPCDRGFGNIERACKKKPKIPCPDHYVKIIDKIQGAQVTKMTSNDFLNMKSLKDRITVRKTANPNFGFAKASSLVLHEDHPWEYKLCLGDKSVMVDLSKTSKRKKDKTPVIPICRDPIPKKYPQGKAIKIKAEKLKDLQHFHDFLETTGRRWIQELSRLQLSANDRPQQCEDEITPRENIQDDDQFFLDYGLVPVPLEVEEDYLEEQGNEDIGSDGADGADGSDGSDGSDASDASGDMFVD